MEVLFLKLVNMSITASWLVLAVLILRVLLKKAPKSIRCVLWGLVGLRLIFPFSLESVFSLIPSSEPLPEEFLYAATPQVNTGIPALNNAVNPVIAQSLTPVEAASANPTQIWSFIFSHIWLIGVILMAVYALVSYLVVRRKVSASIKLSKNLRLCDRIDTPFILGIIRPQIYLPSNLDQQTADHVLAHENAHLKRKDHWWKPLGFALLTVYWFNPVMWLAYILLCRDIEMACDEKVVRDFDAEQKKAYSQALLRCSVPRRLIAACPLAFGEVGVKDRINSVLNYKKPTFWIILVAVIACAIVAVCFLTDPKDDLKSNIYEQYFNFSDGQTQVMQGTSENGQSDCFVTVNFFSSSGPTEFSMEIWYKAHEDDPWIRTEPVIMTLTDSFACNIPANCTYAVMATPLDEKNGYASFKVTVTEADSDSLAAENSVPVESIVESDRLAPGTYIPVECLYMNPLSSYSAFNLSKEYVYTVTEEGFFTDSFAFICNTNVDDVDWGWKTLAEAGDDLKFFYDWLESDFAIALTLDEDAQYQKLDNRNHLLLQNGELLMIYGGPDENDMELVWGIFRLEPRANISLGIHSKTKMEITDTQFYENAVSVSATFTFPEEFSVSEGFNALRPYLVTLSCGDEESLIKANSIETTTENDGSNSIQYRFLFDLTDITWSGNNFLLNVGEFRTGNDSNIVIEDVFAVSWTVSDIGQARTFSVPGEQNHMTVSISEIFIRAEVWQTQYSSPDELYQALKFFDQNGNEIPTPIYSGSGSTGGSLISVKVYPQEPWGADQVATVMIGDEVLYELVVCE